MQVLCKFYELYFMQVFTWPIFCLTHLTFRPQNGMTGNAQRALSSLRDLRLTIPENAIRQIVLMRQTITCCEGWLLILKVLPPPLPSSHPHPTPLTQSPQPPFPLPTPPADTPPPGCLNHSIVQRSQTPQTPQPPARPPAPPTLASLTPLLGTTKANSLSIICEQINFCK